MLSAKSRSVQIAGIHSRGLQMGSRTSSRRLLPLIGHIFGVWNDSVAVKRDMQLDRKEYDKVL